MKRHLRRSTFFVRVSCAVLVGLTFAAWTAPVLADADGSAVVDFFNLSSAVINEGSSTTANLQLSVGPANETGGAGTTTRRFNANTASFSAPGSTSGGANVFAGGGGVNQNFSAGFTYNDNGTFNISFGQNFSWNWQENSSYGLGNPSGNASNFLSGNVVVTVLNVAPQNLTLNIGPSLVVNEGTAITAQMTATDPGADTITFTIAGNGAGTDFNTTPGSTRTSSNIGLGVFEEHNGGVQTFNILGVATDDDGGSSTITRVLTVLNLPPVINSMSIASYTGGGGGALLTFTNSSSDPGNDVLSYAWDLDNNGFFNDDFNQTTFPAVFYPNGTHTVWLRVSDPDGGVSTQSLTFTIIPEPSTLVLLGIGSALALAVYRRRKRC